MIQIPTHCHQATPAHLRWKGIPPYRRAPPDRPRCTHRDRSSGTRCHRNGRTRDQLLISIRRLCHRCRRDRDRTATGAAGGRVNRGRQTRDQRSDRATVQPCHTDHRNRDHRMIAHPLADVTSDDLRSARTARSRIPRSLGAAQRGLVSTGRPTASAPGTANTIHTFAYAARPAIHPAPGSSTRCRRVSFCCARLGVTQPAVHTRRPDGSTLGQMNAASAQSISNG